MARWLSISLAGLIAIVGAAPLQGAATGQASEPSLPPPLQVIRDSNDAILAAFGDDDEITEEEKTRAFAAMDKVTDFGLMSDRAIDARCTDAGELCQVWKQTFADLLRARALSDAGRYRADKFEYLSETIDRGRATVYTLAFRDGEDYTLDYELTVQEGSWKIVNWIFDEVNTVDSYDRQFKRMLRKGRTVEELIDILQRRTEEFRSVQ